MKSLTAILFLIWVSFATAQWSEEIRITYDPAHDATPKIAVDSEGNIHLVWWSSRNAFPYDEEIYYAKLEPKGNKLIEDKRITETIGNSTHPVIAIDSKDNLHLVWRDQPELADYARVYHAKLDNEGNVLVPPRQVIDAIGTLSNWRYPGVAIDSQDNLHIVWDENRYIEGFMGTNTLHYSKLDSLGKVLIQDIRLTPYEERPFRFSVAIDRHDRLHVAWEQSYRPLLTWVIMYAKLDNMGSFLVEPARITPLEVVSRFSHVLIDGVGSLHVFISRINPGVHEHYTKLDNNGNILIDLFKIVDQENNTYFLGTTLDQKGQIYFLLTDDLGPRTDLYFVVLDTVGSLLVPKTQIQAAPSVKRPFHLAADSQGQINVVWQDNRTGIYDDLFFRYYCPTVTGIHSDYKPESYPQQFELLQNYPNPFNAATAIRFLLPPPNFSLVTLKVFDILGNEIITLLHEDPYGPGEHQVIWDGKNKLGKEVSSGIYIYQLSVDGRILTKKILLIR